MMDSKTLAKPGVTGSIQHTQDPIPCQIKVWLPDTTLTIRALLRELDISAQALETPPVYLVGLSSGLREYNLHAVEGSWKLRNINGRQVAVA